MPEWIEKTLGELTSYIAKGIPPKYMDEYTEDTIFVLNQKCNRDFSITYESARMHDSSKKKVVDDKMLKPGDVLINSTGEGTAGRVAQIWNITRPTTTDGHMITLRASDEIDPLYYGYAIKSQQKLVESLAEGSTGQTEINRKRLMDEVVIKYPIQKKVQYQIALMLENIDKKIAVNNAINKNLWEQCNAIYRERFVTNLDASWEDGHLSDLIIVKYGKDHKKLDDGEFPCYGSGGVMRYVNKPLYDQESVLIPRKGTLNNVMYVNTPFWSVDTMFFTMMKVPNAAKFVYHFVKEKDLAAMNAGSAVPSMTTDILNAIELRIPSPNVLADFEAMVTPLYKAIKDNETENNMLAELRDTLLPKLMSGELDVSDLDI